MVLRTKGRQPCQKAVRDDTEEGRGRKGGRRRRDGGGNVSGGNNWLWTFQNAAATYLAFDGSRSHDVVNRNFSPEELGGTVWVTDRWPAYFLGDVGMEDHQICIAHLLRNLAYTMQTFPDDAWSLDMLDLLRDSVHRRHQGTIGRDVRTNMEERLDELLARPPVYTKEDGKETELDKLKKSIAKHRDHVFTFLSNPAVPAHEQRQREGAQAGQDQAQGQRMLPDGGRCGKLRHRSLRHTDGNQERTGPLRGPSGHCGPRAGIASLSQSLLSGDQGHRPMVWAPEQLR